MDDTYLSLILGVFCLVIIINTTMMFTLSDSILGKAPGAGAPAMTEASPVDPIVPAAAPVAAPVVPAATVAPDPAVTVVPASTLAANQGTIPPAIGGPSGDVGPAPVPQAPVALFGTPVYVTVGPPETPEKEAHEMIQAEIPGLQRQGYVRLFTLENQNVSKALPHVYFNLVNPPMIIDYDIKPTNFTDLKYVEYKLGTVEHAETMTIVRPYEQSWVTLTARNLDSGRIVALDSFGKDGGLQTPRQMVIREGGHYEFELAGEFAKVNLTMEAKAEGNIPR